MADLTIFQLPEQTGKTNDDVLAIVDSGDTTTSKIKVSTLLSGISPFVDGNGTNNVLPDYYPLTAITSGTSESVIIGGTGNTITTTNKYSSIFGGQLNKVRANNSRIGPNTIVGSYDGDISDVLNGYAVAIFGGWENDCTRGGYGTTAVGGWQNRVDNNNSWAGIVLGGQNVKSFGGQAGMLAGANNENNGDRSVVLGGNGNLVNGLESGVLAGNNCDINSGNYSGIVAGATNQINSSSNYSTILAGQNNTLSGSTHSSIVGGSGNTITTHDYSVILGGTGLTTSSNEEVVCKHLTISGQSRDNYYDNLSGDTFDVDWNRGNLQKITMTGDSIIQFTNVKNGGRYSLQVVNGGTHTITLAFDSGGKDILCQGGAFPNITNNGVDLCVLEVMGNDIFVRHFADFSTP
jgi:hypothetical protein